MYEPYLDVKYLLQYKEFKTYAIACSLLLAAINVSQEVPGLFMFVEAQVDNTVFNMIYVFSPMIFMGGLAIAAVIIATFNQTNQSYKIFMIVLIAAFAGSVALVMLAFLNVSPGFYAFSTIVWSATAGALKLCIYEFMTEIIFPVSPVFALAILNSMSGLVTLMITMISSDVEAASFNDTHFVYFVLLVCLGVCAFNLYVFIALPYKLNRTDYDTCRRMTMLNSYGGQAKKEASKMPRGTVAVTINGDDEESMKRRLDDSETLED